MRPCPTCWLALLLIPLVLTSGCPEPGSGEEGDNGVTTAGTGSGSEGSSTSSSGSTTTGADSSSTDPGETDPGPTGGDEVPTECVDVDPAVDAHASHNLATWPIASMFDLSVPCTVDAISEVDGGARLLTEMTCDYDGGVWPATLEIPAPFSGPAAWGVGEIVNLRALRSQDELNFSTTNIIRLDRSETELLVFAFDGGALETPLLPEASWFSPLPLEIDTTLCGSYLEQLDPAPQQLLRAEITDCCSAEVRGGQRALFDLSGAYDAYDVDAERVEIDVGLGVNPGGDEDDDYLRVVIRAVDLGA